jgi:hypothetical protein
MAGRGIVGVNQRPNGCGLDGMYVNNQRKSKSLPVNPRLPIENTKQLLVPWERIWWPDILGWRFFLI